MNPEAQIMLDYCASNGVTCGRMLDLGAGDAIGDASIALPFIERGWDVTLVDASPTVISGLARRFGRHSKVKVVQALVGKHGMRPFYEIPDDTSLSTACDALMKRKIGREVFDTIYMEGFDVRDLWAEFGPFDVVSVDLEGLSLGIASVLLDHHRAGIALCVEVFPEEVLGVDEGKKLDGLATFHDYRVHARTKENMILVKA